MAAEPIECQVLVLRVSIHCEGCKKKVKKVLQNINGVYRCNIDARSNKVTVQASTTLDPYVLVGKLRKSGKQADLWPEQPAPPQPQPPADSQDQPKNQADEPSKPNEPAENAEAAPAEPSNPQPSPPEPKQSTGDQAPKPAAHQESRENAEADAGGEATAAAPAPAQQQPGEAKGKGKQQQQPPPPPEMEKQPVHARVTMEYDRGVGYVNQAPMVMSYNQARPSVSASYYAPAPAPAPMPVARPGPGPSQGYIDEHYTPSYYNYNYNRSPTYEPYYYEPPQPSPYRYQYQQPAPSEDYYYSAPPPQRSAFSPPRERDGYGDMFNDENANSCTVM